MAIKQYRTISLLSVEAKTFFSVLAKRLTSYMISNNYIDTSVQKGGIPGFSGCVEHTSTLTQLLHEARIRNNSLTVVWLDLANAYGSYLINLSGGHCNTTTSPTTQSASS